MSSEHHDSQIAALRLLAKDEEFMRAIWAAGAKAIVKHMVESVQTWIGGRVMTVLSVAALTAAVTWAIQTGRL